MSPGITFAVHEVERATRPLSTCKTQEALNALLDRKVEVCSDYTADCIQKVSFHPLLAAAHFAFSQHRPLALSPDMIRVILVQGSPHGPEDRDGGPAGGGTVAGLHRRLDLPGFLERVVRIQGQQTAQEALPGRQRGGSKRPSNT
jgi:hypothetical protein